MLVANATVVPECSFYLRTLITIRYVLILNLRFRIVAYWIHDNNSTHQSRCSHKCSQVRLQMHLQFSNLALQPTCFTTLRSFTPQVYNLGCKWGVERGEGRRRAPPFARQRNLDLFARAPWRGPISHEE